MTGTRSEGIDGEFFRDLSKESEPQLLRRITILQQSEAHHDDGNERRFSEDSIRQTRGMGGKRYELRWYSIHRYKTTERNGSKRTSRHRNRREYVLTA